MPAFGYNFGRTIVQQTPLTVIWKTRAAPNTGQTAAYSNRGELAGGLMSPSGYTVWLRRQGTAAASQKLMHTAAAVASVAVQVLQLMQYRP